MTRRTPADRRRVVSEVIGATIGIASVAAVIGAIVAGIVLLAKVLAGPRIPITANPLNVIFASRLLVAVIRVGILTLIVYAIYSMLIFMKRGQPISRVGPVQVEEAVKVVKGEREVIRGRTYELIQENERLEGEVAELGERLDASDTTLNSVLEYLDSISDNPNVGEEDS